MALRPCLHFRQSRWCVGERASWDDRVWVRKMDRSFHTKKAMSRAYENLLRWFSISNDPATPERQRS